MANTNDWQVGTHGACVLVQAEEWTEGQEIRELLPWIIEDARAVRPYPPSGFLLGNKFNQTLNKDSMKDGWEIKKLGEVCEVLNGLWIGKKEPFINICVIRNTNFTKDCKLNLDNVAYIDAEMKQFATRKLHVGDIIVEKSGGSEKQPVGRVVLFNVEEGDYSFSNFTAALRIKSEDRLNPSYLHKCLYAYYLKGETYKLQSKTTGLHNLDMKGYLRLPIPIPPLPEQERIVSELDCINGILEKKREQIKELDALAQSIFYHMFGDPVINEKGWEVKKLGEVAEIIGGSTPKTNVDEFWDGEHYWVTPAELDGSRYIESTERCITDLAIKKTNLTLLPVGTVLLSSRAPIGKVCITRTPMYCNQGFKNIVCSDMLHSEYVFQFLFELKDYLNSLGTGATFKEISKSTTEKVLIPLPPLSLQQSFATKIAAIEKQKELIKRSIAEVETLLESRMQYHFG